MFAEMPTEAPAQTSRSAPASNVIALIGPVMDTGVDEVSKPQWSLNCKIKFRPTSPATTFGMVKVGVVPTTFPPSSQANKTGPMEVFTAVPLAVKTALWPTHSAPMLAGAVVIVGAMFWHGWYKEYVPDEKVVTAG